MTDREMHDIVFEESLDLIGLSNRDAGIAVGKSKSYGLWCLAKLTNHLPGIMAEIGVWTGGSARTILKANPMRFMQLFDTFEGVPHGDKRYDLLNEKGDVAYIGQFNLENCFNIAKKALSEFTYIEFHKGIFPETTKGLPDNEYSFVHCDTDVYPSVKDCCEYFYPKLVTGAIMVFDDYTYHGAPGAKKAVDEFLLNRKENIRINEFGQAYITKE